MDLAKTQLLSLVTKGITTALGIVQSIIIVRLLSPAEFGLVGLVMSIGSVIGVSQHLGIVDGAIREIAVRTKKKDVATIMWASHIVRQMVTIPLSIILFFVAPLIANKYGHTEIAPYIQIFAAALILQGLQDVWGATLTGMKRFVPLYIIQIITATINIAVFGLLTWRYGISGFFWAIVVTTAVMVALLAADTIRSLRGRASIPTLGELRSVARQIIRIGVYTYLARIFFVVWQRLPLLVLGAALAAEELGYLNISMTFGSKLTIIAMALSEVNLSWMSSLYVSDKKQFAQAATRNMHRVLVLMLSLTLVLLFFTPEILRYVIGAEYLPAQPIILLMTAAFFLYALVDISTSSIFVPADNPRQRAIAFGVLTAVSGVLLAWILVEQPNVLLAAYAMVASAIVSFVLTTVLARRYNVNIAPPALWVLLVMLASSVVWLFTEPALGWRIGIFVAVSGYVLWEARRLNLLPHAAKLIGGRTGYKLSTKRTNEQVTHYPVICFAGAFYDVTNWTNRQHIMTRVSETHSVLYVEPRVWIFRYVFTNLTKPLTILKYFWKIVWWEKKTENLYIISQWNLLPGSREYAWISAFNHFLNRFCVLTKAWWLGFKQPTVWIYDTEASEYLSAFPNSKVLYDCVDDHAAQAGVNRNSRRVEEEEAAILQRADIVTATSKKLYALKRKHNSNTHLVLNAGDVDAYLDPQPAPQTLEDRLRSIKQKGSVLGSVGAVDSYKLDFDLLTKAAKSNPAWQFVFIGRPIVSRKRTIPKQLRTMSNVHFIGAVAREHVPALVHLFDVCLIPYKRSRYNEASFPLKFWEFMATGKPIVVSGTPELKTYGPLITYVKNTREFTEAIKKALVDPKRGSSERVALAIKHGWNNRVGQLLRLLKNIDL